jgi:hypothetical protein
MDAPSPTQMSPARQRERRRQVRGLLLLALTLFVFSLLRGGVHRILTPGWWRLW